jgi:hypothetical protein
MQADAEKQVRTFNDLFNPIDITIENTFLPFIFLNFLSIKQRMRSALSPESST